MTQKRMNIIELTELVSTLDWIEKPTIETPFGDLVTRVELFEAETEGRKYEASLIGIKNPDKEELLGGTCAIKEFQGEQLLNSYYERFPIPIKYAEPQPDEMDGVVPVYLLMKAVHSKKNAFHI